MSIRRNSNKPSHGPLVFAALLGMFAMACCLMSTMISGQRRPGPQQTYQVRPSPGHAKPAVNPLQNLLRVSQGVKREEGTAVVVLMDTSGSMAESVRDGADSESPKIEIARRCAERLISRTEEFVRAHPDQNVLMGVYEFSQRYGGPSPRRVVKLGPPNIAAARSMIARMTPQGGTPIGGALIAAKQDLDATGRTRQHIIVVTDGQNTEGYEPQDVMNAISRLPEENRTNVYFIAFDISEDRFTSIRDGGGLVMAAADGRELEQALDYVLTGKILAEQPEVPRAQ